MRNLAATIGHESRLRKRGHKCLSNIRDFEQERWLYDEGYYRRQKYWQARYVRIVAKLHRLQRLKIQ